MQRLKWGRKLLDWTYCHQSTFSTMWDVFSDSAVGVLCKDGGSETIFAKTGLNPIVVGERYPCEEFCHIFLNEMVTCVGAREICKDQY